jgi:hypothetical protein
MRQFYAVAAMPASLEAMGEPDEEIEIISAAR